MHVSWEGFGGGQADILVVWGVCVRHRIVGPGHCRHVGSCVVPKIGLERGVLKWAPFLCEGHVFSRSRRWSTFEGLGKGENKKKRGRRTRTTIARRRRTLAGVLLSSSPCFVL